MKIPSSWTVFVLGICWTSLVEFSYFAEVSGLMEGRPKGFLTCFKGFILTLLDLECVTYDTFVSSFFAKKGFAIVCPAFVGYGESLSCRSDPARSTIFNKLCL